MIVCHLIMIVGNIIGIWMSIAIHSSANTPHTGGHSVTPEAYTSLAQVCVEWRFVSSLELSVLCLQLIFLAIVSTGNTV